MSLAVLLIPASGDTWAQGLSGTAGAVPTLFGLRTPGTAAGPGRGGLGGLGGPTQGLLQTGGLQTGGLQAGSQRFQRGNQQSQFVGRDVAEVSEFFRSLTGLNSERGARRGGFRQGFGADTQRRRRNRFERRERLGEGRGNGQNRYQPPRTRLRVAFSHRRPSAAQVSENLQTRLNRHLILAGEPGIATEMRNRTIVLRGTVASAHDRSLAERLARLEPGVSEVENLLRVEAPPAEGLPQ